MKWPMVPFAKVAEVVTGNTPPKKDLENYGPGIPWIKPPDLDAWEPITHTEETLSAVGQKKTRLLPPGTVMVCCIGSIGRVGITGTTLATNQQINSLVFGPLVEPKFGYYYCRSITKVLESSARQAVVSILNKGNFEKIEMPLPPLSEQRRIVEILDQTDALRKKHAEADAKAERILPAFFYKMFGDPATNPNGLSLVPIRSLVSIVNRRNPSDQADTPFRYIDISGVDGTQGRITEVKNLLGVDAPSRARQVVKTNDVLISTVRPYLQATALVPSYLDNQICSTGFCVLRAKEGKGFGYLYALTRLPWFTERLNEQARGASYPAVSNNDVLDLCMPYPKDAKTIFVFDNLVFELCMLQEQKLLSKSRIESLYATLLHRAFSGDLTAKWREAHMKELLAEMEEQD